MKGKPAIIISLLFGVLAWVFVWLYLSSRETELLQIADLRKVVVAQVDILEGTAIEENMITEIEVPKKFQQPGAFESSREVVGQIAAVPIKQGAQVLGTAMTGVGRNLATKIPRGMRGISVAVTDVTGVSSLVAANNYVDVLATVKLGSAPGSSNQRTFVTTLFQNVLVLAVGSDLGEVRTRPKGSGGNDALGAIAQQEREKFSTVTLALTPQQAQDLILAQDVGDLTLALRSFREGNEPVNLNRSSPPGVFGVDDGSIVPRRAPSWQEIRGTVR
jgi:pilus assembly protein CpaB